MAHAQKPDFIFRRNGRVHLNRRGRQFSRLVVAEVCASAVVMLDTPCSEVVWRVLCTHSIRHFPLHFPSRASPCDITFQLDSTNICFLCDQRGCSLSGAMLMCVMLRRAVDWYETQQHCWPNITHIKSAPLGLNPLGSHKKEGDGSKHALYIT